MKHFHIIRYSKRQRLEESGLTGKVSETLVPFGAVDYTFEDFLYDVAKATYGRITEHELLRSYGQELTLIYEQVVTHVPWISIHPHLTLFDVAKQVANCLSDEISYQVDQITEDAEIELLEWNINPPAQISYGSGTFIPPIARNEVQRLRKRPERLDEDFEDAGLDKNDISFNYIPYRVDSDFEQNALLDMLQVGELKNLELYYNGYKDDRLQNFFIKTDIGIYTPDFLVLKRQQGKSKGEITKILILETKARTYYNDEFKRKEKFVKDVFLKHNPQCGTNGLLTKKERTILKNTLKL